MAFTPTSFTKGGQTRIAATPREAVWLEFTGWVRQGAAALPTYVDELSGTFLTKTLAKSTYVVGREQVAPARGAVIFCVDDCKTQAVPLVAIHDALHQKVCLGVVSAKQDTGGYLTSAQLLGYHNAGHELANHSNTHPNYTSQTAAQRRAETDACTTYITNLTGVAPKSFIYPQGAWSATTDRELYGVFRSWRATLSPATGLPAAYPLDDTFPRYYAVDVGDPANLERAKALIRLAAVAPVIVSTYVHYTDDVGVITTAQYQSLAQLAYDLGVPAVLPRDMIGRQSMLSTPSFEGATLSDWIGAVTGAATYGQATVTPDAGLAGTKALTFTATGPDTATVSQAVALQPGVTYRVSGRIQQPSGNLITNDVGVQLKFRAWDESAISSPTTYVTVPTPGLTWGRFEFDVLAPVAARFAWLGLLLAPGVVRSGTVNIDHLDIRPADHGGLG